MFEGLPRRAMYLCDKKKGCNLEYPGCPNDECFHTSDVCHAKNGPVVNVREWETRFEIKEINGLLWYWEKEENG